MIMTKKQYCSLAEPSGSARVRTIGSDPSEVGKSRARRAVSVSALALALVGAQAIFGQADKRGRDRANEIVNWNNIMFKAAQVAVTTPLVMTRVAAIVQGAVFDAVNGIERR